MSISRIDGIPVAGLSRLDGFDRDSLVRADGLGPLPGLGDPVEAGTLPAPWAYYSFESQESGTFPSLVGDHDLAPVGEATWLQVATALCGTHGVYSSDVGDHAVMQVGGETERTSYALSFWRYNYVPLSVRDGYNTLVQFSVPAAQADTWEHVLLHIDATGVVCYVDGSQVTTDIYTDVVTTGLTLMSIITSSGGAVLDELAIWESPDWTAEQIAARAVALYNGGDGTAFRDGQWYEVAQ